MKKRFEGYTIVEMLIVIVVFGLLAGIGVANFRDAARRQEIDNVTKTLVQDLRLAQENASSGRKVSGCNGSFRGYLVSISSASYTISAVCSAGNVETKTVQAPTSLSFTTTVGLNQILFKPLESGTDIPQGATSTITISSTQTANTGTVIVSSSGEIK